MRAWIYTLMLLDVGILATGLVNTSFTVMIRPRSMHCSMLPQSITPSLFSSFQATSQVTVSLSKCSSSWYFICMTALILLFMVLVTCIAFLIYLFGWIRMSRSLHKQLMESILGTTFRSVVSCGIILPPHVCIEDG